ncbi:hypothetical protein HDU97_007189 [Phlyctochytrium planicorne]|nr:hypothetical protein HDU97_007189 [Phlyctochytrium planicorne]
MRLLSPSTPTGQWLLNIFNFTVFTGSIVGLVLVTRAASDANERKAGHSFNTIATLLLLAVFKSGLSVAMYIHQIYNSDTTLPSTVDKQSAFFAETFADVKSMAILGAFYSILGVLGHNPFDPEIFAKPSVAQLVSFLLTIIVMKFLQCEKLDHLRWMSLTIVGGAFLNLVALSCRTSEALFNWFIVTSHCILRILHSLELKKSSRTSLHLKNIILNLSSLCTLALLYVFMDLVANKDTATPSRIPVPLCIMILLLQSIVELIATGVFKFSNVIVSELSIAMSIFISTVAFASKKEMASEVFSLKLICLIVALLATAQYLFAANMAGPSPAKSDRQDKKTTLTTSIFFDILEEEEEIVIPRKASPAGLGWKLAALPLIVIVMIMVGFISKNSSLASHPLQAEEEEDSEEVFSLATNFTAANRSRWFAELDEGESFYEKGLAVVIPVAIPQTASLENLFRSLERYCGDCNKVRFLLIASKDEVPAFEAVKGRFTFFKKLEVKAFGDVYPDLRDPSVYVSENEFLKEKTEYTYRSMKKLMGCLQANTKYCWMLDPESFMFQDSSLRGMVKDYFLDPHIVHSSHEKFTSDFTLKAKEILGYQEFAGWVLEEYLWFMETDVLKKIKSILDSKFPKAKDLSEIILVEVIYYLYIIHNRRDYWQYRVVDSANIYGPYFENALKTVEVRPGASIEDLRHVIAEYPNIVAPVAERYTAYGLSFFRPKGQFGTVGSSASFLDLAYSTTMCVGEQDPELYEQAMTGRWAKRKPTFPKREIDDYCLNFESVC